jgi:hypothetical protein
MRASVSGTLSQVHLHSQPLEEHPSRTFHHLRGRKILTLGISILQLPGFIPEISDFLIHDLPCPLPLSFQVMPWISWCHFHLRD